MVGYTYSTWKTELAILTAFDEAEPNFVANLPSTIDYAEQRIYRDLNLLSTIIRDATATLTIGSRSFTLPTTANGPFKVVQGINILLTSTTRQQTVSTSREFIDFLYPNDLTSTDIPGYYAMISDQDLLIAPATNTAYNVEVIGTIRPNPLSVSNTATYLSQYLPDLFMAASMIFMSGYMKNFGAQSDDPAQAQSWEGQYKALLGSAATEEARKRYNSTFGASPETLPKA